ncbi:MAG: sulfurtransferase TusA family protein [Candidatus Helarchaeota archaeon]
MNDEMETLNLIGETCPFTFIYTKLKLEEIDNNKILEVIIDYPLSVENVPRSVEEQRLGKILEIKKIRKNTWKIKIKKL